MKNRTYCGAPNKAYDGKKLTFCGWVHHVRDLGGLSFFTLRDHTGLVQITPDPDNEDMCAMIRGLHHEDVLKVTGTARLRPEGNVNPDMPTGEIEILADSIELLSGSKVPPFLPEEAEGVQEDLRLKHRMLHLRTDKMQHNFRLRHKMYQSIRRYFDENGFCEIETPFLVKPTPEGARDYLVPSRLHKGRAYALPQSPQIYKQILMIAGFDRYFQIVKCFRDEDLRSDRQPEFTQIDVELSFTDEEEVQEIVEGLMVQLFDEVLEVKISTPFPKIPYAEAMLRYGSDKPDLRIPLEIVDITDVFQGTEFKVFSSVIDSGGAIRGIKLPGCGGYSRRQKDGLIERAKKFGLGGLVYFWHNEEGIKSTAAKFLTDEQMKNVFEVTGAEDDDLIAVAAHTNTNHVAFGLGAVREWTGKELNLIDESVYSHCWITDFPMFEFNEEMQRYQAAHHPFTAPVIEDMENFADDPSKIRSRGYDLVLNGSEIAGGSIRIHQRDIQRRVFELLGFDEQEADERFGFLLDALELGAPPHGGIAFGLDRMVMIFAGVDSIREIIAFPKTTTAISLMDGSPAFTTEDQWAELGLKTVKKVETDNKK